MRCRWLMLFTLVAALAKQSTAYAQAGAIDGFVTDQAGNPLRGVKIEASSDVQIGKGRKTYTNAEGTFHIGGLTPGNFKVTATSPGMQTVVQDNVMVGITSAAEVNLMMEVKTEQAVVVIVEKAPVISTTKAAVKQSFDSKLVEAIPFRDTINQFRDIILSTPGTVNLRVRGGGANQTEFLQDGFLIRDNFPPSRSAQAFETQTAAYGADAPTASGGVTNMVTRSGSNKWEFEFGAVYYGSWSQPWLDNADARSAATRVAINPVISGPIIKDKLWFHLNIEPTVTITPIERDALLIMPEPTDRLQIFPKTIAKLSWQATARNKIDLVWNSDFPYVRNELNDFGVADEAQRDRLSARLFAGVIWESLLQEHLLLRSQVGWFGFLTEVGPARCRTIDKSTCYDIPQILQNFPITMQLNNFPTHSKQDKQSIQFVNSLEYFLSTAKAGEHKIRLRDFLFFEQDDQRMSYNGNMTLEFSGASPTFRNEYYANDPRLEPAQYGEWKTVVEQFRHVLTLSDQWKPTRRWTATAALSFAQASAKNNKGGFPFSSYTFAPGLAVVWDVTGNGKNVLRTSGSVYVDIDLTNVARFSLGSQVRLRCGWDPVTQQYSSNCTYSGGSSRTTVGELGIPKTWEYTLGGQREVVKGLAIGVDFVYRKFTNQFEDYETNRIWNESGTAVIGFANGQNETVMDLETYSGAERRYVGLTALFIKTEGNLRLEGSYTWSRLDGTVLDGYTNAYGNNPVTSRYLYGPLPDDHRHEIKITSNWQAFPWLSTGVQYAFNSGFPRARQFYNNVTGSFDSYRAGPGIDPGVNLNDPADDLEIRYPDQNQLNVKLNLHLLPIIKHDLTISMDFINLLNNRYVTTMGSQDGRNYGLVTARNASMQMRLNLLYKWQ